MLDLLQIPDFLTPDACEALRAAMRAGAGAPAGLIGEGDERPVLPLVRRATQVEVGTAMAGAMTARLSEVMPRLAAHFGAVLGAVEAPQFLAYGAGDYFVAHQDGNTPLIHDRSRFRRVSVILFLSRQAADAAAGDYGGGSLVFHAPYPGSGRTPIAPAPGTLVAFRAETTHEVEPVAWGERLTVASWYS